LSKGFKSGYIGVVGRTNVGKSTLINSLLEQKVVITSDKPQTTRDRINCILNLEDAQIIFTDSPGFFKPKNLLIGSLNAKAERVFDDADIIMVVVDVAGGLGKGDRFVIEKSKGFKKPKILVLNKTDKASSQEIKKIKSELGKAGSFNRIIGVSALKGDNTDRLIKAILKFLPYGPKYFPDGSITDQPFKDTVSDIVREKLSGILKEEIPHSINVIVESIEKRKTKKDKDIYDIKCDVFVEKTSQKAIVIGKKGSVLSKAGREARIELENLTGVKVFLEIWVKVALNWTREEKDLKHFGYI